MLINAHSLANLTLGFKTTFNGAFNTAEVHWPTVAMLVASGTKEENYGWLGSFPSLREWLGARIHHNLSAHHFNIVNRDFEMTVDVDRNNIEDDQFGIYGPMMSEMGLQAKRHPDMLIFEELIPNGFADVCYDGQAFFDTDHPVKNAAGVTQTVSNDGGGSGAPWVLIDASRAVRPFVLQKRRDYQFVSKTNPDDENVFEKKKFTFGVDGRLNAGYGLWQLAYGSKATLSHTNYATARAAMMTFTADGGRNLGVKPTHLVTGPTNEQAALAILNGTVRDEGGVSVSNEWKDTAKLVIVPALG